MLRLFRSTIDFAKKAILVVGVFLIIFAIFGYVINSNRPRYDENKTLHAAQKQLYDTLSREKLNIKKGSGRDLVLSLYKMGYCSLIGELCTDKLTYGDTHFKKSLMGKVSSLITMTYTNPPASGAYWVTNTLQNAGFIPRSYAAEGMGFAMIKPLMNLWKIFRDVAYLIIVIFLVAIGFMIMFRTKINPQTVISVENSLPKVVVAILLITFSFAIAGFLIDIMYLTIILAIGILSNNNTYYDTAQIQNMFLNSNLGTLWDSIIPLPKDVQNIVGLPRFGYLGDAFMALLPETVNNTLHVITAVAGSVTALILALQMLDNAGALKFFDGLLGLGNGVGSMPQIFLAIPMVPLVLFIGYQLVLHGLGFVVGLIVSLAVFSMILNIFFLLLKSYIQITISIVFSPIILLFEALPGNKNFSFWIKGLIGELLTFPLVIALLLVEKVMFMTMSYPGDFWTPPFVVNLNPGTFSVIFGLGLILITPDLIKLAKESVGAKPLPFNIGVGTFMSGGGALLGGGMSILQTFSTMSMGISGMKSLGGMMKGTKAEDWRKQVKEQHERDTEVVNWKATGKWKDGSS